MDINELNKLKTLEFGQLKGSKHSCNYKFQETLKHRMSLVQQQNSLLSLSKELKNF